MPIDKNQFTPEFDSFLKKHAINQNQWNLPFVYIFGRDSFMTTLYGVNIYPENIKTVLDHPRLQPYLTGRFTIKKFVDAQQDQYLQLRLELKPDQKPTKKLSHLTQEIFVSTLNQLNSEYNQVEQKFGPKMHPKIIFHAFNHPKYFPEGKTIKTG